MRPFGMPEVFLLVGGEDGAGVGDEVGDVEKVVAVLFDDGAGDDVDVELGSEGAVGVQIFLVLSAERGEAWIIRDPVC